MNIPIYKYVYLYIYLFITSSGNDTGNIHILKHILSLLLLLKISCFSCGKTIIHALVNPHSSNVI